MSILQLLQAGNILANDVEFQVDDGTHFDVLKIGMLHRVGDDGYLEGVACGVADG